MIPYPETGQFRHVIDDVRKHCARVGQNTLPVMKFTGTVKLHGTNAAIGYQKDSTYWCQSRNNVITPQKDNAGFAKHISPLANDFFENHVLPHCAVVQKHYENGDQIIIFGEWCGGNIQKNVAISGLPTMFMIFKIRVRIPEETATSVEDADVIELDKQTPNTRSFWIEPKEWTSVKWPEKLIFNIYDFPTYEIDIDFNCPEIAQNKLVDITDEVERQCPVGAQFNKSGVGEGVVWTEWAESHGSLTFKVKGEKHAVTKVKTLAPVNIEKLQNLQEFVEYACTENRMNQGLDYLREQHLSITMQNLEPFMKWLVNDIIKEEADTMAESNINPKDVGRSVQNKARTWFKQNLS